MQFHEIFGHIDLDRYYEFSKRNPLLRLRAQKPGESDAVQLENRYRIKVNYPGLQPFGIGGL
jgi:hypothetical protein